MPFYRDILSRESYRHSGSAVRYHKAGTLAPLIAILAHLQIFSENRGFLKMVANLGMSEGHSATSDIQGLPTYKNIILIVIWGLIYLSGNTFTKNLRVFCFK